MAGFINWLHHTYWAIRIWLLLKYGPPEVRARLRWAMWRLIPPEEGI